MKKIYFFSILAMSAILFAVSFGTVFACTYHAYQSCNGNSLYWYDSCGNPQELAQYCAQGCNGNTCGYNTGYINYNNNSNYNNCTYHAYKLCVGNGVYWYDSCGTQQDLFQICSGTNTVCKYGQCVYQQPYIPPVVNPYITHNRTACSGSSVYWYDSLGRVTDLYKSCADSNSCTLDNCGSGKCTNVLKCDGTTCVANSADYNTYCVGNGNPNNNNNNSTAGGLLFSFFAKQDQSSTQWQKTVSVGANGIIYFMISAVNDTNAFVDNVNISANIPTEITSVGNLQVDGVKFSGDIVSGVNIGTISPKTAKSITFEGKTQGISAQVVKQAIATATVSGAPKTDSVSITLMPGQAIITSASASEASSGFLDFLKRWYLWILVGFVLIFLFVVVFRRLSNNA
ncbi:MAG: hypothetical protein NTV36_00430 [Candidatus Staskawiczbacteria bacterium]|nr:hypothetical protein [Candidatus Staskawiczbacteria bacterium]